MQRCRYFISAFIVSLVQIPIIALIINSYHLSPEMVRLTWQYAIGVMVAAPFGLISTVGVLQLQIIGKTKILLGLSVTESVVNLFLDFLFVGLFHMGIAGAGYGTMAANILRCLLTVLWEPLIIQCCAEVRKIYGRMLSKLRRNTDVFQGDLAK